MALLSLKKQESLTIEELRELFIYDPASGIFTRRFYCKRGGVGTVAGTLSREGYWIIAINRTNFAAHRLAWFYVYCRWPLLNLDHINGIRWDNRIINLREASDAQNAANSRAHNGRLLKGITRCGNKWQAQIMQKGRNLYLGRFETAEQAAMVYAAKAKEIHGEFAWVP